MKGFVQDIESCTNSNNYFWRALFTAKRRNIESTARNNALSFYSIHRRSIMRYLILFVAVLSLLAFSACERPTTVEAPDTVVVTPPGPAGPAGAQGEQGTQGVQGAQGMTEKGDTGATGDTGAEGAKGEQGNKGDTGGGTIVVVPNR